MSSSPASERPSSPDPEDVAIPPGPMDPASTAIHSSLARAVHRLQAAEDEAKCGAAKGVHRLRTSARRLRSELQAFGKLVEPQWREKLTLELKWLGRSLGEVRDLDVLRERFTRSEAEQDHQTLKPLYDWLDERHARATRTMKRTLKSKRFQALMGSLQAEGEVPLTPRAEKACRKVLPPLVVKAWDRLQSDARDLTLDMPDTVFHDLRKRAKRARYTIELVVPALGRKVAVAARTRIQLAVEIQDVLGEHQDATVAIGEIESFLSSGDHDDGDFRDAVDRLLGRLRTAADESLADFLKRLGPKLKKKKYSGKLDADG